MKNNTLQIKNILFLALGVALILLLPWLAMQLNTGVDWNVFDFSVAGALLFGTGLAYLLVAKRADTLAYRLAAGLALATALLLIWVNLAVGIIGSEDNPANLMYLGVLAVLGIGALLANFRPQGMALALFATALAQAVVTVIALLTQPGMPVVQQVLINGFFAFLWVASAALFRNAGGAISGRGE